MQILKHHYQVKLRQTIAKRVRRNNMNNAINNSIINSIDSFNSINNDNNNNSSMHNSNNNTGNNDNSNFASAATVISNSRTTTPTHNPVRPQIHPNGLNLVSIVKNTRHNTKTEKTLTLTTSTTVSRKISLPSNPVTPQGSDDENHDENKSEDKDGNQDEMIGLYVPSQTINNLRLQGVEIDKKTDAFVAVAFDGNSKSVHAKSNTDDGQDAPNGQNAQDGGVKSNLDSDNEQDDKIQHNGEVLKLTVRNDSMSINNIAANKCNYYKFRS